MVVVKTQVAPNFPFSASDLGQILFFFWRREGLMTFTREKNPKDGLKHWMIKGVQIINTSFKT